MDTGWFDGYDEEKQQHFCHGSSPFYSAACVGSLLRTQLAEFLPFLDCIFSMVKILAFIAFKRLDFQNRVVLKSMDSIQNPSIYFHQASK